MKPAKAATLRAMTERMMMVEVVELKMGRVREVYEGQVSYILLGGRVVVGNGWNALTEVREWPRKMKSESIKS